jgi:hypothetical protein
MYYTKLTAYSVFLTANSAFETGKHHKHGRKALKALKESTKSIEGKH